MKKTLIGLLLVVAAMTLTACVSRYERDMQIAASQAQAARYESQAAQAQAQAAQAQAQAQAAAAQARADAQAAMAASQAEYKIVKEQESTKRETAWFGVLPWLLLIVAAAAAGVGSWWLFLRARVQVEQVRVQALLPAPPVMMLPPERRIPASVQRRADATGARPVPSGSCWLLVDAGGDVVDVMEPRR